MAGALFLWPAVVLAHAPYEHVHGTYRTSSGGEVQLVRSYVDGIMGTDPVKVILREPGGTVLAETDYLDAAVVICPTLRWCRVFEYKPPDVVFPVSVRRVHGSGFEEESSRTLYWLGAVLPLWAFPWDFGIACVALAAVPLAFQGLLLLRRSPAVIAAWVVFALGSLPWLGFWLLAIALNVPVAWVWVFSGAVVLASTPAVGRAVLSRGPTKRSS